MRRDNEAQENSITVLTNLFEHREVKAHFINPCCFGEDFAAWLRQRLLVAPDLGVALSEPIQEDYGWGFYASRTKDRVWIAISYVGDGPQEEPAEWIISSTAASAFNLIGRFFRKQNPQVLGRLRDRIRQILASNSAITIVAP